MYRIVFEPKSLEFELSDNNPKEYEDLMEWLHNIETITDSSSNEPSPQFMWHAGFWTYLMNNRWIQKQQYMHQRSMWNIIRTRFNQLNDNCEDVSNECIMHPNRLYGTEEEECIGKAITGSYRLDAKPLVFISDNSNVRRSAEFILEEKTLDLETIVNYQEYKSVVQANRNYIDELNELSRKEGIIVVGRDENFAKERFSNIQFIDGFKNNTDFSVLKSYNIRLLWTDRMQHGVTNAVESQIGKSYVHLSYSGSNPERFAEYVVTELTKLGLM